MSFNLEEAIKVYAQNLGVSVNTFKPHFRNPNNQELFESVQHKDLDGSQSRLFALCFQEVRNAAGPYKIFGSRQAQGVTSCILKHAEAWKKTQQILASK